MSGGDHIFRVGVAVHVGINLLPSQGCVVGLEKGSNSGDLGIKFSVSTGKIKFKGNNGKYNLCTCGAALDVPEMVSLAELNKLVTEFMEYSISWVTHYALLPGEFHAERMFWPGAKFNIYSF